MEVSIDIADALQAWLNDHGHSASAWPLPSDFDRRLPFTRVTALGATRSNVVVDDHRVQLETWAETQAEAMAEIKSEVITLSVDIAEKLLQRELGNKDAQSQYIDNLLKNNEKRIEA